MEKKCAKGVLGVCVSVLSATPQARGAVAQHATRGGASTFSARVFLRLDFVGRVPPAEIDRVSVHCTLREAFAAGEYDGVVKRGVERRAALRNRRTGLRNTSTAIVHQTKRRDFRSPALPTGNDPAQGAALPMVHF
ncbi:hypothetical protein DFJ73DRAFT_760864 [Zopfochytrium polystomum]|nr:hypothetical protein DFJ73DRAFT_760864 [Zopfochytrium polystomum]